MLTCSRHAFLLPHDLDGRVVLISMYLGVKKMCFLCFPCVCNFFECLFDLSVCVSVLSISCTGCEEGKYALESGSTTCRACSDGKTTQRNMNSCVCKPGYAVRSSMLFLGLYWLTVFL
jgi:hypothetical protein